ncbi:MAG: transglutaminase domain-containing protein [Oscillospiraceae bacterium]|nr:transglutaminase domain-containing protein [Oscillospiraceae bacterium]
MSAKTDSSNHRERQSRALRHRNLPKKKIPVRPALTPSPSSWSLSPALQARASANGVVPPQADAQPKKRRYWFLWLFAFVQLALIFALYRMANTPEPEIGPLPDLPMMEVRYQVPGGEDIVETILCGENAALHEPVEVEGCTFLGWTAEDGKTENRASFPVYRDTVYTAKLIPAFETEEHIPYLSTDEEAVIDVDGPVTVREFVNILYLLLDTEETGSGRFVDVPEEDSCYEAAAYLKDLGVLSGPRLHPDSDLVCGDMLETLCRFFPASNESFVFQDLEADSPYYSSFCTAAANGWIPSGTLVRTEAAEPISRGRFARIMNHILHRDAERNLAPESVGTILDVPPSGDYYDDVVEALIPHRYRMRGEEEIWTESEALPVHEPGFFFAGVRLHYIDEDGVPAVNGNVDGLDYNRNGEVTSGDSWLDRELWAILEDTVDPKVMEREEMLRAVYDYVVHNYTYRYGSMYEFGAEGWAVKEARRMLEYGSGNCYCFAALFYELARFVGYDARIYSGRAYGEQYEFRGYEGDLVYAPMGYTPHGWVEIEFDGEPYIFDTEYEYRSYGLRQMFKADDTVRKQYGYVKAES